MRPRAAFVRSLPLIATRPRPWLALALTAPLWLMGCATTVFPPERIAEPVQVGVLDHGHHTSLVVELPGDGMIRYSYGDWQWYALRRTGPVEASAALLWPSQAALGRKELPGPFSPTAVSRQVRVPIEHALYVTVDAQDVRRLVQHLDRIFDENSAARVYNEAYDLVFVPHPEPYSIMHNSNQVVREWLEQLGCRVEGGSLFSIWRRGANPAKSASGKSRRAARSACPIQPRAGGGSPRHGASGRAIRSLHRDFRRPKQLERLALRSRLVANGQAALSPVCRSDQLSRHRRRS